MIIWNGWGFLVAVIAFACLLASEAATEAAFADSRYYQQHGWPKMVAFLIAALLVWLLNFCLSGRRSRIAIDVETHQPLVLRADDSLFFIPLRYWAPLLIGLAFVLLFVKE
jgi:hypothetical protein